MMVRCILYTHKLPDKAHLPRKPPIVGKSSLHFIRAQKNGVESLHTKTHTHQEENLNKQLHGETVQAAYLMAGL